MNGQPVLRAAARRAGVEAGRDARCTGARSRKRARLLQPKAIAPQYLKMRLRERWDINEQNGPASRSCPSVEFSTGAGKSLRFGCLPHHYDRGDGPGPLCCTGQVTAPDLGQFKTLDLHLHGHARYPLATFRVRDYHSGHQKGGQIQKFT